MANKQTQKFKIILIFAILIFFALGFLFYFQNSKSGKVNHISEDLKISLTYPKGWYIDDRYQSILLTNYETNQNERNEPSSNQVKIYISNFSSCFPSIEEDLRYPACGENKLDGPDEIVSRDIEKTKGGTFHKYITRTPRKDEIIYYLLENGDRTIEISKEPDPSKFEKEFEEIINSMNFL